MNNNRYTNPSGFPENLPQEQLIEDNLKTSFQKVAESYGYTHLETASIEYMDTLASKGDVSKEIYTIGRALGEGESDESQRGLHFDLTVPFARYVAQHQGDLWFPYRRFQIQKVWRGERPQKGRFREFYQADVDVVSRDTLAIGFDAEIALVMAHILDSFELGAVTMHINNRKFLNGLFESLNITDTAGALHIIDKLDKIGETEVRKRLKEEIGLSEQATETLFNVISKKIAASDVAAFLQSVPGSNPILDEGKNELRAIFQILTQSPKLNSVSFVCNPSIARGLDYYTGTVYETTIQGLERYGSICSGGRYADLASRFTNQKLPGVGMSIGLTRLLTILKEEKLRSFQTKTNSDVLLCLLNEAQLIPSLQLAAALRKSGYNVEVNYKHSVGLGKQLEQAADRGIPFALVCETDATMTVFDMQRKDATKSSVNNQAELLEYIKTTKLND